MNFSGLSGMGDMLKNVRSMADRMKTMQDEMKKQVVDGESGGGMVKARMNGAGELVGLEIESDVIDPDDPEMLADLVVAAVNADCKKTEELRADSSRELSGGVDLSQFGIDLGGLGS